LGDPAPETPVISRILYGGAIIVLPTILHPGEVTRLFSFLVGTEAAAIVAWLQLLGWPWLIGLAFGTAALSRRDWLTGVEMMAVAGLAVVTPPLLAFTIFFCGMHSARHILRTVDYARPLSAVVLWVVSMPPTLGILVMFVAAWDFLPPLPMDARATQLVFVGLAALTVPHMAVVERVRLAGWVERYPIGN
jgi:Brp/Blh family beta-carotene 15,15'-monooxygenase